MLEFNSVFRYIYLSWKAAVPVNRMLDMQNANTARRAFGYARVSSEKQLNGDSLEAQRRIISAICTAEGYELAGVFSDAATSAGIPLAERPEGARLLAAVQRGDIIVAVHLDRAFRDTHDAAGTLKALQKRGVGLYLKDLGGDVTANSVSSLVFELLAAVSSFARSRIREGVRAAKRDQKARNRFLGGDVPFGYTKVTRLEGDKPKLYIIPIPEVHAEARKLKDQGYSARLAAGHFRAQGHTCTHVTVGRLWQSIGV